MKHTQRLKTILASLLVTLALTTPAVVLSSERAPYNAELYFEGARLEVMEDGSVQAIFNVAVDRLQNWNGVTFFLYYNREYLTPSYISDQTDSLGVLHKQNEAIRVASLTDTDGFFSVDAELYGKRDDQGALISPFKRYYPSSSGFGTGNEFYSNITLENTTTGMINMRLRLNEGGSGPQLPGDGPTIASLGEGGKIKELKPNPGSGQDTAQWFVVNREDEAAEKVILGQLSFRVKKENLAEMVRLFGDFRDGAHTDDPYLSLTTTADGSTRTEQVGLLYVKAPEIDPNSGRRDPDPWSMTGYEKDDSGGYNADNFYGPGGKDTVYRNAEDLYRFQFDGKTPVDVTLAEPEFTINAYQNYTEAEVGDVAISLGRYSPMATVTYADGSQENLIVPWGLGTVNGYATGYDPGLPAGEDYDPTGSWKTVAGEKTQWYFTPSQKIVIHGQLFPVPVQAKMTVTPIWLEKITANDLERSYTVQNAAMVQSGSALQLPTQARLITDIVPSGVSLVIPIPGWSPDNPHSHWPTLEPDNSNKSTLMNALKADSFDPGVDPDHPNWPSDLDRNNGNLTAHPDWFLGDYTFHLAESYGGAAKERFTRADVWAVFPWLSAPDDTLEENYPVYELDKARRHIVDSSKLTDAEDYNASYVSTVTADNGEPTVTFTVKRANSEETMREDSVFRIWLPDGTELGTGLNSKDIQADPQDFTVPDWFDQSTATPDGDGWYKKTPVEDTTGKRSFQLETNTGDPNQYGSNAQRDLLRRYINLGGWFNITVCEDVDNKTWSRPMPVYVPPRKNLYTETKVYNFVGENAGLFSQLAPLGKTITLPHGFYTTVDQTGIPYYKQADGTKTAIAYDPLNRTTLTRWQERYGISTLYDGQTGGQPGTLYKFTLNDPMGAGTLEGQTDTTLGSPQRDIYKHGPEAFLSGAVYEAFGEVHQPDGGDETATVRREETTRPTGREEVTLTSTEPSGITWKDPDVHGHRNVALATYDTVTLGYQSRQDYTFTITNVGDVDIYGLSIDGLTDGYPGDPTGGRFVMLQPPADFLAVGQSTTFVLTYVYNLPVNEVAAPVYRDTLYITSDRHPTGGMHGGDTGDYLLDFDAQFTVAKDSLHRVNLRVFPEWDSAGETGWSAAETGVPGGLKGEHYPMGTAEVIIGPVGVTDPTIDETPATRNYPAGYQYVYVLVDAKDEYTIDSVVCTDAAGTSVAIPAYSGDPLKVGTKVVYRFEMPDADATVTVRFREDILSKLRLEDLIDFSAVSDDQLKRSNELGNTDTSSHVTDVAAENTYKVWRKRYSTKEQADAKSWSTAQNADKDFYLMTCGTVIPKSEDGQKFLPSENQYLVVIPYNAERSQVEATLRRVLVDRNGLERTTGATAADHLQENKSIQVEVTMARYSYDFMEHLGESLSGSENQYHEIVYQPTQGMTGVWPTTTDANRSVHTSQPFDSPDAGQSCYVRIRLSGREEGSSVTQMRYYYLEIRMMPEKPVATLNYGNSPYGMIMNASKFISTENGVQNDAATAANREAAKKKFRDAGYTFAFAASDFNSVPNVVVDEGMDQVTYWREAWVKNGGLYEPESHTGQKQVDNIVKDENDPNVIIKEEHYIVDDPSVYDEKDNLDLNDYAYFAILGQDLREPGLKSALDSSGRPVDVSKVKVTAQVTLLDETASTQLERFSGTETVTLDLGWSTQLTHALAAGGDPNDGGQYWPVSSQSIPGADGKETTVYTPVTGIRPGRYVMTYTYTDFDGESTLSVTRDFVILYPLGDVNVDLTRDSGGYDAGGPNYHSSDEYVLENRISDPLGYELQWLKPVTVTAPDGSQTTQERYPYANIFKYRVCDVNNDRNVNNIDANLIHKNVRLAAAGQQPFLKFYDPVHYGLY